MRTESITIAPASGPAGSDGPELDTGRLLAAAERGADQLAASLLPTGQFAAPAGTTGGNEDLVEHFGALWAMLDVRGYDPAVQEAGARGVRWAIDRHYQRAPGGGAFGSPYRLLTGPSGLALVAMDELAPEYTSVAPLSLRAEIVDYLLANQLTEGPDRFDFPRRIERRAFTFDLERNEVSVEPDAANSTGSSATSQILFGLVTYLAALTDGRDAGAEIDDQRLAATYAATGNAMAALMGRGHGVRRGPVWAMYAIRRFADLTDRLLAAAGHSDHELARESRRDLLGWAGQIATVLLTKAAEASTPDSAARTARRAQALVQFLDLLDVYSDAAGDPQWWALVEPARRQLERDCGLLLAVQDPATGAFRPGPDEPVQRIADTRHAISALLGAASIIG